jgi:ribosome-associated protein
MPTSPVTSELLLPELEFIASRSSGPGGQNVNKVNTKVTLRFDVSNSSILTEEQRNILIARCGSRITSSGILVISVQDKRSQQQNKEAALERLDRLLQKAFEVKKRRKATKPTKASREDRIKEKKQRSEKKKWRQNPL